MRQLTSTSRWNFSRDKAEPLSRAVRGCDLLSLSNASVGRRLAPRTPCGISKMSGIWTKSFYFADRARSDSTPPMLLRPISSPPVPAMSERQEVDVMIQFLACITGGEQAEKQTVLFALDNHANDATASVRPTHPASLRSPAPSSRRRNAPPVSPRSPSCASACGFAAARCPYASPPATRPPTEPATASRPGGRSRARLERVAQDVVRHTVRLGVGESQRSTDRGARVRRPRHHLRRGNLATPASSVGTRPTEAAAALGAARDATPDAGRAAARDATSGRRASVRLQSAWRGLAQRLRRWAEQPEAE